jgi:S-formylglutathione hydrolase FrmB
MSLIHGSIPITAQVITAALLLVAIGRRSRQWLLVCVPFGLLAGLGLVLGIRWYIADQGLAEDPAPPRILAWIALTGLALVVAVLGWPRTRWWRRGMSILAVAMCAVCVAMTLNASVGYLPTVAAAWDRLTGAPLPGQTDRTTVAALQRQGKPPDWKTIVKVRIPDNGSGFKHRDELVLLPPAWYASVPPPPLPVVMMIGGEFGQPAAWLYAGNAQQIVDDFARAHGGNVPILVFPDYSGAFSNDTECVDGPRGNAADHLTKDVVPYMISSFGVSSDPASWAIVGWSSGGTCALTLSVMHPELFSAFVDIDGQFGPNAGTKDQTIARLFGGDAGAWAQFDPRTVITEYGRYQGMSAWFAVSDDTATVYRPAGEADQPGPADDPGGATSDSHAAIANQLCRLASGHGIECAVVPNPGNHDFASAASGFAAALPWLAGKLGTPGVPKIAMPGQTPP